MTSAKAFSLFFPAKCPTVKNCSISIAAIFGECSFERHCSMGVCLCFLAHFFSPARHGVFDDEQLRRWSK